MGEGPDAYVMHTQLGDRGNSIQFHFARGLDLNGAGDNS